VDENVADLVGYPGWQLSIFVTSFAIDFQWRERVDIYNFAEVKT
jgi:hypothetical protein